MEGSDYGQLIEEPVNPVRDGKVPQGPALCFETAAWAAITGELKAGGHRF